MTFKLEVTPEYSVKRVKEQIQVAKSYSLEEMRLIYQKKEINDAQSLQELRIPNNAKLYLLLKLSSGFDIFVKSSPTGKTIVVNVEKSMKIHDLKARIQDKEGIPPDQQLLVFEETGLNDENRTIESYGIYRESVLGLFLKLNTAYYLLIQIGSTAPIQLEIESSHTLRQLQETIQHKTQIPEKNQRLFVSGKQLKGETKTLANFIVQNFSTIHVLSKLPNHLIVIVTTASHHTFYVQVDRSQTVLNIKYQLRDVYALPLDRLQISFNGALLNEDASLTSYQNQNRCVLSLELITTLHIQDPSGQMFLVETDLFRPISFIKNKVLALSKQLLQQEDLQLIYRGTKLMEKLTVKWYKISDGDTLVLTSCYCDLIVELFSGRRFWISIPSCDLPISALKQRIEAIQDIPATEQILYFHSSELTDLQIFHAFSYKTPIQLYRNSDQIIVIQSSGTELKVPFVPNLPVSLLREQISSTLKLSATDVFLTMNGRELNDSKECLTGLSAASRVQVSVCWSVLIRDLTGKVKALRVRDSDPISKIKEKVQSLSRNPMERVRLLYRQEEINTGIIATLPGFGQNSVLHLQTAFQ